MIIKLSKSQSILEYVAIVLVVAAAMGATTFYLSRALTVRDRHLAQEMNEANR
ncbi:MAG: hypothetical protein KKH93_06405 [Candidatus Omnitrophica bacterium]|nr:hypothetical protein [Candidatus Omnitrophota bacterium]MBU2044944.1 hypothetical protein [Candidatus Omnitrophota bacterium]MBU2250846.1 hypothetical protein [Candidatus Omnitrophota bacterium]MBU2265909.1 hypothetical protein [Candidatus Omnitrophota bacterium]MBU2473534.1 hypothetical protein [Candidatus Omnitrophota bacterium]